MFSTQLGNSENDLRLRAVILQTFYGDPYGPSDVIALVHALLNSNSTMTGILWSVADKLPGSDLPAILDGIDPPAMDAADTTRRGWEAGSFYARILIRAWPDSGTIESARVMAWLRKRVAFRGGLGESRAEGLRAAMRVTPERLGTLAEDFFKSVGMDDRRWLAFSRFREAIFFELSPEALAAIAVQALDSEQDFERRLFLYEVALSLAFQMAPPFATARFDDLWQRAEADPGFRAVRDALVAATLPGNYFVGRSGGASDEGENRARQQAEFDQDIDRIRRGEHLSWLQHLACIYFTLYSDTDQSLSPRERIAAWLGEDRADAAIEALRATLSRNDLPSFDDVMALIANHEKYDWWYAALAGLNERLAVGEGSDDLSDDFLKGMLVFDITNSLTEQPCRKAMIEQRPDLVRDAYLAVVKLRLSRGEQIVDGLRELLTEPYFEPDRGAFVLDLLRQFPNADPFRLGELLDAVLALPSIHQAFLQLAGLVISGAVAADERQRDLWLVTAYVISSSSYENAVLQRAAARPGLVFDLRDQSGFAQRAQPDHMLPLPMLEFMARLTGWLFPSTPHPVGGWGGDQNAWDASDYFRTLINMISAAPSAAATDALQRLDADPQLASYKPDVQFALASQRQRRRDNEYDRPDWPKTVAALANRAPATVADLHALLMAQLRDLARRIARANTDIFKQFWNLDSYARPTEPRPEESCRDDVITLLKPALLPLGIMVEPEGHMVADKRADISVAMPGRKILCELKRDYHTEVWTAITGQLERFYAHDPEAKGFGIFVVFWFGAKRPNKIPSLPNGMPPPNTALEMEAVLQSLLPSEMRKRLAVIVLDVSGKL